MGVGKEARLRPQMEIIEVQQGGKPYRMEVDPEDFLDHCASVVAKTMGFEFKGKSMIAAAANNPRAAQFVDVARKVLFEVGLECQIPVPLVCRK